jgi:tetratricopeptide (TPR) repeat protein
MGRFSRWFGILVLLAFALPLLGQASDVRVGPSPLRIPPPADSSPAEELETQGDTLRAQKLYLDSIDYYRAAMKKADSAVLHNKAGISFLQLQRNNEAKKEFQEALKRDTRYPEAYNNLGVLHYKNQRYGAAVKEYRKALKLTEANASFHSNLGTAYFAEKDYERATREFSRALAIDPSIFDTRPSAGVAARLVSSNDLGRFHYVMAQMYGQKGDVERCRYYLSKANEDGFSVRDALRDSVFSDLRKDPNFVAFVRSLKVPSTDNN